MRGHGARRHEQTLISRKGDEGQLGYEPGKPAQAGHEQPPPYFRRRPVAGNRDADSERGFRALRRDQQLPHCTRPTDVEEQGLRVREFREEERGRGRHHRDERTVARIAQHPHQLVHSQTTASEIRTPASLQCVQTQL